YPTRMQRHNVKATRSVAKFNASPRPRPPGRFEFLHTPESTESTLQSAVVGIRIERARNIRELASRWDGINIARLHMPMEPSWFASDRLGPKHDAFNPGEYANTTKRHQLESVWSPYAPASSESRSSLRSDRAAALPRPVSGLRSHADISVGLRRRCHPAPPMVSALFLSWLPIVVRISRPIR